MNNYLKQSHLEKLNNHDFCDKFNLVNEYVYKSKSWWKI